MVTKNFLRNFSVTARDLRTESQDREKKSDISREREGTGDKEPSRNRTKTRSTTPKARRPVDSQDDKRRSKTPSKPRHSNPLHRNGYETESSSQPRALAEPRTPAQAALAELLHTPPKTAFPHSRGALSDDKAYRKNPTDLSTKGLPELSLGGTPTTPGGKSRQLQPPGASPVTPKPPRGTSKALPLFSIDRLREGLSVPSKGQGSFEEPFGAEHLSQTSSDAEGMLKLLGSEATLREENADLRRQLQESELGRAEAEASRDAAVSMVAEAELANESARLKAEAALAESEEFRQAAELALEEAMQSFQEREGSLQETVTANLEKLEAVVLEKAELEERLADRELQIQSMADEMHTLRRKVEATEAALSEAMGLLGTLEKKVKEDADSAGKKLGELRRKVTMARVKSTGLVHVEDKQELEAGQSFDGERRDKTKTLTESISAVGSGAQEPRMRFKHLTVSLSGNLRWNSRRSDPVPWQVDQQDGALESARSRKNQLEDDVVKSLKLQAGRIEQLVQDKMQTEVKMEAVVVEALSWADQSEQLEEKLLQETQKWAAERTFLKTQLAAEDKELNSLEQEVLSLKQQVVGLQSEKQALVEQLSAAEEETACASAQALVLQEKEKQGRVEELEAMVEAKNKELLSLEQKLAEWNEQFVGLEARMQQEAKDWYAERSSLEAQVEAKNKELLDSDDKVVALQQQLLEKEAQNDEQRKEGDKALEDSQQLQEKSRELEALREKVFDLEEQAKQFHWEKAASDSQFKATIAALEDERDALAASITGQGIQKWAAEKQALEAELVVKSRELSVLSGKLADLEEALKTAQGQKSAAEAKLQAAMAAVAAVESARAEENTREANELRQKVSGLEEQLLRAQEEKAIHSPKAAAAAAVGAGMMAIDGEVSQPHNDWEAERASLQAEVEDKRQEITTLRAQVDSLSQQISHLQAAVAAKAAGTAAEAELRKEIVSLEREKAGLLSELTAVKDRLSIETQKWEAERASLEAGVEGKNREVMELGQRVVDSELLVMQVQQEKGELEARLLKASAALEAQLEERNRELTEADRRLEDLNQQVVQLQEEKVASEVELRTAIADLQKERGALENEAEQVRAGEGEGVDVQQTWAAERAFLERQLEAKTKEVEELDMKVIGLKRQIFQLQEEKAASAEETAYMLSKFKADVQTFDSQRAVWEEERWTLQFLRMSAEEVRSEHEGVKRAMKWVEELQAEVEQLQRDRDHLNEEVAMLQEMMREKAQAYQVERDSWHHQVSALELKLEGKTDGHCSSQTARPLTHKPWGIDLSPQKEKELQRVLRSAEEQGEDLRSSPSKSESSGDESSELGVRLMSTDSTRSYGSQEEVSLVVDLHRQLLELQAKYVKLHESKTGGEHAGALGT